MRAIMADNDVGGHLAVLLRILRGETWRDLWLELNLPVWTFADLSLEPNVADAPLWHACQREKVVLITGNRNKRTSESLQATIQVHNTSDSLPVLTLSEPTRVLHDREYAERVAESLIDYLLYIDNVRGAGRLWLP